MPSVASSRSPPNRPPDEAAVERLVVVALLALGATACTPEALIPSGVIERAEAEARAWMAMASPIRRARR
jgi:hypothetical protein